MKYIQTRFILCAMIVASPLWAEAQITLGNETDSLAIEQDQMVQVAFEK